MDIGVLGPVEVSVDGQHIPVGGVRAQIVLATLALEAGRIVPTGRLIEALWDANPPATARSQVHICVSGLRRVLAAAGGRTVIETRPPGYVLVLREAAVDAEVFRRRTVRGTQLAGAGELPEAALEFQDALALWRGPALAGLSGPIIESWAMNLHEQRLATLEKRINVDLALGRHGDLVGELGELVAQHPLHERFHGALMVTLYRSGRQAEALDTYRRARAVLVEQLGIEPGEELRRLERMILGGGPGVGAVGFAGQLAAQPAAGSEPEQVRAEPEQVRAPAPPHPPWQLPPDTADFSGRTTEADRIRRVILAAGRSGPPAIVAISGPGGVGKSALALRVAHSVAHEFTEGQLYANLSGGGRPSGPEEILARFLRAFGVIGTAVPNGLDELGDVYRDMIAARRLLIVLDGAVSEAQVLPLLPGNGHAAVIVTCRSRLTALPGAEHLPLNVLDGPVAAELLATLVGGGASADDPDLAELAELCGRLPLALRIAGARLASRPHWTPGRLNARLRDETRRLDELEHGSLGVRASIASSYTELRPPAQRLLCLLACLDMPDFEGWVSAALLGGDLPEAEDLLDELVDAHLVEVRFCGAPADGPARFRLHDLVRVFARERACADGSVEHRASALRQALAGWLYLAEEAHRREYGGDYTTLHGSEPRWALPAEATARLLDRPLAWLESERRALVGAVRQAVRYEWDELAWDLALTLVTLFEAKSYLGDWQETAELALDLAERTANSRGTAAMLYSLGTLHLVEQRYAQADERLRQALSGFESCGEQHGRGLALRHLAFLDRIRGQAGSARQRYERALPLLREAGDQIAVAHVLSGLSVLCVDVGETERAQNLLDDALLLAQIAGSRRMVGQVLFRLGEVYLEREDLERGAEAFHQVLRIARDREDRLGEAYALLGLGRVRHREGRLAPARTALELALVVARELHDRLVEGHALHALGRVHMDQRQPSRAEERLDAAVRTFGEFGGTVHQVNALISLCDLRACRDDTPGAVRAAVRAVTMLADLDTVEAGHLRERITGLIGTVTAFGSPSAAPFSPSSSPSPS